MDIDNPPKPKEIGTQKDDPGIIQVGKIMKKKSEAAMDQELPSMTSMIPPITYRGC